MIKYLKPTDTYIFVTSEYIKNFEERNLKSYYNSLKEQNLDIILTDIENPTNSEEIANKISDKIMEINNYILDNKHQGFLNLTSGTPAIVSVLALFAVTGQLNRTMGLYAPNPEYDNQIKTNSLDYYKNSFAYQTIKNLINQCDYIAVEDFLNRNKILPKLNNNIEFKIGVSFAKNRVISNFDKAEELYNQNEFLRVYEFKKPNNLYDKSIECLMSAKISENVNDIFQATLKLGIIRENITSFLLQKILEKKGMDIIENRRIKDTEMKFLKKDVLEKKYPELIQYLDDKLSKSNTANKKLDLDRELNSFLEGLILEYLVSKENDSILNGIQTEFYKLEKLKKERNNLAHTINAPYYDKKWIISLKTILKETAKFLNYPEPKFNAYGDINKNLLKLLKSTLN